jgi:hypothetical protein
MARFLYTDRMIKFLKITYTNHSITDTTRLFNNKFSLNKTTSQIKSTLSNHDITCGRTTGEINKGKSRLFTAEQHTWIEAQYKKHCIKDLTAIFNCTFNCSMTVSQIRSFTRNHKIKSGRTGQFNPGQTAWNDGMKGWDAGGESHKARFKKGHIPLNQKPVGSERIDTKEGYVMVKVADPNTWRLKHIVEWEKVNGKIPDDHVLWFIDNDRTNCSPDNLMLATKGQHAVANKLGLGNADAQSKETVKLLAQLSIAAATRKRNNKVVI